MADPGFPVGGGAHLIEGGELTPDAATFRKICMSKRKNLDPWGGGVDAGRAPGTPPRSTNGDVVIANANAHCE